MTSPPSDRRAPFGWLPGREQHRGYTHITDCALFHRNLQLTCTRCAHVRVLSGHALWWLFERKGWGDRLIEIGRRFRCTACWERDRTVSRRPRVAVVEDHPSGPQPAMPDEREWKRLVSRQRS
jgi:hypothetical protein